MTKTHTVVVERDLPHPPEKIWRALTQPHLIAEWLMQNDFEARVGHKFNLRTAPYANWNGVIDSEVLAIEPNKALSYKWDSGEGNFRVTSVVTWTLTPTGSGTHLRMEQSGFRSDQPQNYAGAKYGWEAFLGKLEQVLAKPEQGSNIMSIWIRQFHRWTSIVFTLTVIANFAVRAFQEPPMWVTYSPLPFLFLLLFTGLYMFALPYVAKGRGARAGNVA